jgi:hypothetical protein
MRRVVVLLALLTATVALTVSAAMAEAQTRDTIDCERKATSKGTCAGTEQADRLLDEADAYTDIRGKGENDLYIVYSGANTRNDDRADDLYDNRSTSNDTYRIANSNFVGEDDDPYIDEEGELYITDEGGEQDTLDLSSTGYDRRDCTITDANDDLFINCTGEDDIVVVGYCERGKQNFIETFRFADDRDRTLLKRAYCSGAGATSNTDSVSSQDQEQTTASQRQEEANTSTASWERAE